MLDPELDQNPTLNKIHHVSVKKVKDEDGTLLTNIGQYIES